MMNRSVRRWLVRVAGTAALAMLVGGSCVPADPVDADVDDTFLMPSENRDGETFVVQRDNPALAGTTRLDDATVESTDTGRVVCCNRLRLQADHDLFHPPAANESPTSGAFVSVQGAGLDSVETGEPGVRWRWQAPAVLLPPDHSTVSVTFSRSSGFFDEGSGVIGPEATQTIQLRLSPETLVLPVHVHQFIDPSRRPDERRLRLWLARAHLDSPGAEVTAESWRDAVVGRVNTAIRTNLTEPVNRPPDKVWLPAGIQFRLTSFELIENRSLARDLLTNEEATQTFQQHCTNTRLSAFHDTRRHVPGIHVYVGGRIDANALLFSHSGLACGTAAGQCGTQVPHDSYLMVDLRKSTQVENTLAHEIGHYLGLKDLHLPGGDCGRALVGDDAEDNLMGTLGFALTDDQITRARLLACDAAARFGTPPASWC